MSKSITNRLKLILPEVVSKNQSAFIPGRLITDNVIVAYKMSHFMRKKRVKVDGFAALKIDIAKAYDRVEWSYLEEVIRAFG